jgi:hypothetical protein
VPGREFSERDHARVLKLTRQGCTASEVGAALCPSRSAGSVRRYCERAGIPLPLQHVRSHDNAGTRIRVPDEVARERDRRAEARAQCQNPNHVLLGDPLLQESALYRRG